MWLLSTARAELHFFISPEDVPGGYAILSHVWDDKEQSFKNVCDIIRECNARQVNPREYVDPKIRNTCILAETHGLRWIWIDTCCIDKSSSAELSEAINSMFKYYSLSAVCYAFLRDVGGELNSFSIWEFKRSRWHTRGWTLQELLAPPLVLFVSNSWDLLGSKADLAHHLQLITRIPESVLRMERPVAKISIAQRMAWASHRETTRKEDRAYSLLGIFDINMPTLYGEGERAFRRLQEEILKRHADTTLFAWGGLMTIHDITAWKDKSQSDLTVRQATTGLFAVSPDDFDGSNIEFTPAQGRHKAITSSSPDRAHTGCSHDCGDRDVLSFSITPYGIRARLPTFQWQGSVYADLSWTSNGTSVFLRLENEQWHPMFYGPTSPLHSISAHYLHRVECGFTQAPALCRWRRLVLGSGESTDEMRTVTWQDIYFRDNLSSELTTIGTAVPSDRFSTSMNLSLSSPIRIPSFGDLVAIAHAMRAEVVDVRNAGWPWNGDTPTLVVFKPDFSDVRLVLQVGQCRGEDPMSFYLPTAKSQGKLWANFVITDAHHTVGRHDCSTDHIATWSDSKKHFFLYLPLALPQQPRVPGECPSDPFCGVDTLMMHVVLGVTPWFANPSSLVISFCKRPVFHHPRCPPLTTLKKSNTEGAASETTTLECLSGRKPRTVDVHHCLGDPTLRDDLYDNPRTVVEYRIRDVDYTHRQPGLTGPYTLSPARFD